MRKGLALSQPKSQAQVQKRTPVMKTTGHSSVVLRAYFEPQEAAGKDRRLTPRRKLKFEAESGNDGLHVNIRDLSTRGLLFETSADLSAGEMIEVLLPVTGMTRAVVVWRNGRLYGGKFTHAVSTAAIAAALLLSEPASEHQQASECPPQPSGKAADPPSDQTMWLADIERAIAPGMILFGLGYLVLVGGLIAFAAIGVVLALLVAWGFWVMDNTLEL